MDYAADSMVIEMYHKPEPHWETLSATVDRLPDGRKKVYAERIPDTVTIVHGFWDEADPDHVSLEFIPDDGYIATFTFDNGTAIYRVHEDYDYWRGTLLGWQPV